MEDGDDDAEAYGIATQESIEVRVLLTMLDTRKQTVEHLADMAKRFPGVPGGRSSAEMLVRLLTEMEVLGIAMEHIRIAQETGDISLASRA